jgi:hypothetical protein
VFKANHSGLVFCFSRKSTVCASTSCTEAIRSGMPPMPVKANSPPSFSIRSHVNSTSSALTGMPSDQCQDFSTTRMRVVPSSGVTLSASERATSSVSSGPIQTSGRNISSVACKFVAELPSSGSMLVTGLGSVWPMPLGITAVPHGVGRGAHQKQKKGRARERGPFSQSSQF